MSKLLQQLWQVSRRVPFLRAMARLPVARGLVRTVHHRMVMPPVDYERWMKARLDARRPLYQTARNEPGLLSFLTTAWNTPPEFLRSLADSLLCQASEFDFEWVILDQGSQDPQTRACLAELAARHPQIRLFRVEQNLGIIRGTRYCLERATGRYVLPLDHDDWLYPDCLRVIIWHIQHHGYPPLLYSDEDKLQGRKWFMPFLKPDWDPVLFVNFCFISHLCAIDRRKAQELGVYSDTSADGCHDWDTFFRFWLSGHTPVHVPEVIYSWRLHEKSCAQNIDSKSFIYQSHRAVLNRYLTARNLTDRFELLLNPLLRGFPDWWLRRKHVAPRPLLSIVMADEGTTDGQVVVSSTDYAPHRVQVLNYSSGVAGLKAIVAPEADKNGLICLISERVRIETSEWPWESLGLMERHPETAMVGGAIRNPDRLIADAGIDFGFGGGLGCPHQDRPEGDSSYATCLSRQRSVSAASSQFCVFDAAFLRDLLEHGCPGDIRLEMLGAWAGAHAWRTGRRVVYSPFMQGNSSENWQARIPAAERIRFLQEHAELLPDHRYYSVHLSLNLHEGFRPVADSERRAQEQQLVRHIARAA